MKIADAGGIPLLVARSADKLEETKHEIEDAGGTAYAYSADLSDLDVDRRGCSSRSSPSTRRRHARQQRRALDPALDRAELRPLPRLRAHDPAQLLRHDQADHRRCCRTCASAGSATSSTSPSIGVQTNPPRFSAYVASKAALDAFTRVVASETIGDQRHVHDDPHAARAHADDRADEDVRLVPDDQRRGGRRPDLRGDPRAAEADQHAPGDVRRGRPTRWRPRRWTRSCTWPTRCSPTRPPRRARRTRRRRRRSSRSRWRNLMQGVHW